MNQTTRQPSAAVQTSWLLLVLSLRGRHGKVRVRVWRSLRTLGAAALRDGVYLLPDRPGTRLAIESQRDEVVRAGGAARVLTVAPPGQTESEPLEGLFDRTTEYETLAGDIRETRKRAKRIRPTDLARTVERFRRRYTEVTARDFFPGAARQHAGQLLDELASVLQQGEPRAVARPINRLDVQDYRGRTWATRRRPWADRLASGWLIKRFIDPRAKFRWLSKPADCPSRAIGFDFDGATFTHVGSRVTFEVLAASFGLDADPAIEQIGRIIHYLDVGGLPVPEAPGIAVLLQGARTRLGNDDALLNEARRIFDLVYASYAKPSA